MYIVNEVYSKNPKMVTYETESISFLAPKIWLIVPQEIKNFKSLDSFKKDAWKWKPICPCRLCEVYLQHVGLLVLHSKM